LLKGQTRSVITTSNFCSSTKKSSNWRKTNFYYNPI